MLLFASGLFLISLSSVQTNRAHPHSRAWADSTLQRLRGTAVREPASTIATTAELVAAYAMAKDPCALAEVYGFRSTSFTDQGSLDSAMACAQTVFKLYQPPCDSTVLMRGYVAIGLLYRYLGEWHAVDSICTAGLALYNPGWKAAVLRNSLLTNQAVAAAQLGDLEGAEKSFRRILLYARQEGAMQDAEDATTNIGVVKEMLNQLDSAEYYYRSAMKTALAQGNSGRVAAQYQNLAVLAGGRKDFHGGIGLLDSALFHARRASDLALQVKVHRMLAYDNHQLGDDAAAYEHSRIQYDLQDSLLNEEKVKALTEMQEKYESEKKAKEILGLKAENLEGELQKARVKRTRNIYLFSGIGVLGLAIGLWNTLRRTRKSRAAIQQEKEISEGLLHNILPEEVAAEIKTKGYADVHEFPTATVLFTDFKGFTSLSEKLTAPELVAEIDHCFKAFDGIVEKYGVEKIKTIGDAYMAAGGLPDRRKGSPRDVVMAALEMQEFMRTYKAEREATGRLFFEMRVGIHTGPVIAGIVGVKKYAYDIWGDTVNTASRMESSGETGKVNISATTFEIVKDQPDLRFTPRGMVQAKGKGEMNMYFVHRSSGRA